MAKGKQHNHSFEIVVIGGSAGGIDAITTVLSSLPLHFPLPVVIVQHLKEQEEETKLHLIFSKRSDFPVLLAPDGGEIKSGCAYLAHPGKHLKLSRGRLHHDHGQPVRFVRPSVDVLFSSAAEVYGQGVLGVILSGLGSDGAAGCQAIKDNGGVCIAQEKDSAMFCDMPEAAIKKGGVDYILPADIIGIKLVELVMNDTHEPM